ncbi:carboxymuconolactone decarboxylase family protein [Corynebacterium tapiri]|uniref:Carboxymuconolactone decarboxylase family protein n=1 Tax=Corynebacterium tapiri TaxID=1448266 RepID=A0A5C4U2N7_9CORY|nr:carboxymuconolactone decarboxylase family protein [Corynebacterium tapiri]TNL96651.1 carboxymuconolactone decarboxylase family protein [Corynebacterium tapiri]
MTPNHGPYLDKIFPDLYSALGKVNGQVKRLIKEVDLDPALVELALVRASQINGCAACLSIHVPRARRLGVAETKLDILPSWRETDVFNLEERTALELAEHITLMPAGVRKADAAVDALQVFAEEQVAVLEWAIVMINSYNRLSIMSGHPPLSGD